MMDGMNGMMQGMGWGVALFGLLVLALLVLAVAALVKYLFLQRHAIFREGENQDGQHTSRFF